MLSPLIEVVLVVSAMMGILSAYAAMKKNATIIDVGWSLGIVIAAGLLAFRLSDGHWKAWLLVFLFGIWALRLCTHLLKRMKADSVEDRRYAHLRKQWGPQAQRNFLILFEAQALLAVILASCFLPVFLHPQEGKVVWLMAGVSVWILGLLGETMADEQLKAFKSNPQNKGKTCQVGWWQFSRHPNYFFEWVMWLGYALYALGFTHGYTGLLAAGIMFIFLTQLTGIPYSEHVALQTRGDAYRRYQQTTSPFIPWFRAKK